MRIEFVHRNQQLADKYFVVTKKVLQTNCRCCQCLRRFVRVGGLGLSRPIEITKEVEVTGIEFLALGSMDLTNDVVELLTE